MNFRQHQPGAEAVSGDNLPCETICHCFRPMIVGKKQSVPVPGTNKEIYAVAVLNTKSEKEKIGIVPCGGGHVPPADPGARARRLLHSLRGADSALPAHDVSRATRIASKTLARVTRNADIDADNIYDEDLNYRDHMAEVDQACGASCCPVRLELSRAIGHRHDREAVRPAETGHRARSTSTIRRWILASCLHDSG